MTEMFNAAEIAEDKDLTIAQLQATVRSQYDEILALNNKLATAGSHNCALATDLIAANEANTVLKRQLENQTLAKRFETLVMDEADKIAAAHFDSDDFKRIVNQQVDCAIEKHFESAEFCHTLEQHINETVESYLENTELDVEWAVEKAVEEALGNVRISFR